MFTRSTTLLMMALIGVLGTSGCRTLEFYERGPLLDPVMSFDENAMQVHWAQKVQYSREGSVGGVGATAGGGCGCF